MEGPFDVEGRRDLTWVDSVLYFMVGYGNLARDPIWSGKDNHFLACHAVSSVARLFFVSPPDLSAYQSVFDV